MTNTQEEKRTGCVQYVRDDVDSLVLWHKMRHSVVSSTESAALFGSSPYQTKLELFARKSAPFDEEATRLVVQEELKRPNLTDRRYWGRLLEPKIAEAYAEATGQPFDVHEWTNRGNAVVAPWYWNGNHVMRCKPFVYSPATRMGSSFDYLATNCDDEKVHRIVECKNVDRLAYMQRWARDRDEDFAAVPEHIYIQVQHQLHVLNTCLSDPKLPPTDVGQGHFAGADVVAMIGGNQLKIIPVDTNKAVGCAIEEMIARFWDDVASGRAPDADYTRDAELIANRNLHMVDDTVLQADEQLEELIRVYVEAGEARRQAESQEKEAKAKILDQVGNASKVLSALGTLSCGVSKESPGKLITDDMVGTYTGARKAFRQFRFSRAKS